MKNSIDNKLIQIKLVQSITKANKDKKSSKWERAVYFVPNLGLFIWDDQWMINEIIFPLINNEILIYNGLKLHQGEKMPEYIINPKFDFSEFNGIDYHIGLRKIKA